MALNTAAAQAAFMAAGRSNGNLSSAAIWRFDSFAFF